MKALLKKNKKQSVSEVKVEFAVLNAPEENQTLDFARFRSADLGASIGRIFSFNVQFMKVFALTHAILLSLHVILIVLVSDSFWFGILLFFIGQLVTGVLGTVLALFLFFRKLKVDFRNLFELTLGGFSDVIATSSNAALAGVSTDKVATELFGGYVGNVIEPAVRQTIKQEVPVVHRIIVPITSTVLLRVSNGLSVVMAKAIRTGSLKLGQDTRVEQRLIVVQRAIDHCKTKVQNVNEKVFYVVLRLLFFVTVVFSGLYFILIFFIS